MDSVPIEDYASEVKDMHRGSHSKTLGVRCDVRSDCLFFDVDNRVSEIRSHSHSGQWDHISGLYNPADIVCRGASPKEFVECKWLHCPDVLHKYKSDWQEKAVCKGLSQDDPYVHRSKSINKTAAMMVHVDIHPFDVLAECYSRWCTMKRAIVWWLRLKQQMQHLKCKGKQSVKSVVSTREWQEASDLSVKHVQSQIYSSEIDSVENHCVNNQIDWKYIPPEIPHMGSLWKYMVCVVISILITIIWIWITV